jgi:hypothetical protein
MSSLKGAMAKGRERGGETEMKMAQLCKIEEVGR